MNSIWYNENAENWNEAFPLGNGRLGAMIYGKAGHEIIELNEESVWSKIYADRNNKNAKASLKKIRELVNLNRISEAQEVVLENFTSVPEEQAYYKCAGKIHIDFYDEESFGLNGTSSGIERKNQFKNLNFYKRELNLKSAIAETSFSVESVVPSTNDLSKNTIGSSITYYREAFISSQEDVLVLHIWASTPKSIYLRASIEDENSIRKFSLGEDTIASESISSIPYSTMINASTYNGRIYSTGSSLVIEQADEVTLFIDVESAFGKKSYAKKGGNVKKNLKALAAKASERALKKLCFASCGQYDKIRTAHINDFSADFNSVSFSLGNSQDEERKISAKDLMTKKESKSFNELKWKFSRYMLISSIKKSGKLPPLKNGLWLNKNNELKKVRYDLESQSLFLNCADSCGLKNYASSFFTLEKKLNLNGKKSASEIYGKNGSVSHNSSDLWGDTSPCGTDMSLSYKPFGLIYNAASILSHYEYSLDKKFLKKNYHLIKNAADFFCNYLVSQNENKNKVLVPSFSSGYTTSDGTTVYLGEETPEDTMLLTELFKCAVTANEYLGVPENNDDVVKYKDMLKKLKPVQQDKLNSKKDDFENTGNVLMENNFEFLLNITSGIICSKIANGRVEIHLLENLPEGFESGKFDGASLKGNLFADISWENKKFKTCRLYAKPGMKFFEEVKIFYEGKSYNSRLTNGSLDVLNVLPTTI
ncbi:MAG: glycoside hydrolase family 95 protein [Spirochaetia bacterium]|nr:glycoside hydrolase family 95 protein [Spirochaetia bacterium]